VDDTAALQRRLDGLVTGDLAGLRAAYLAGPGPHDFDGFLGWLHERGDLPSRHYTRLLTGDTVELTLGAEATLLLGANASTVALPVASVERDAPARPEAAGAGRGAGLAAVAPGDSRYVVMGRLGRGGMGEVLAARDRVLRRVVAFKQLLPEAAGRQQVVDRFLAEAQITAQLDHPNVIHIYGLEVTANGDLGYAMKLIQGRELADIIAASRAEALGEPGAEGASPLGERLEVFVKMCDAVAYAHAKGVIHRDLKPANVMVGAYGEVYVVDWGIARLVGDRDGRDEEGLVELADLSGERADDTSRTRVGQALGTPLYMSPEQARGLNADLTAQSDIFTLGLILQELVTLERARQGGSLAEVILAAAEGHRVQARRVDKGKLPRELLGIIDKATAREPEARYASASALADDVQAYLRGEAVTASPDTRLQRWARWLSKHRGTTFGALAFTGVVLPLLAAIAWFIAHDANVEAAREREARIGATVSDVAAQSRALDAELMAYEAAIRELVGAAGTLGATDSPPPAEVRELDARLRGLTVTGTEGHDIAGLAVWLPSVTLGHPVPPGARPAAGTYQVNAWALADDAPVLRKHRDVRLADGTTVGLARLDVPLATLEEDLHMPGVPALAAALLVDGDRVVARWLAPDSDGAAVDAAVRLGAAGGPLASVPVGAGGFLEPPGTPWLVVYEPVHRTGWRYLAIFDLEALLAR